MVWWVVGVVWRVDVKPEYDLGGGAVAILRLLIGAGISCDLTSCDLTSCDLTSCDLTV